MVGTEPASSQKTLTVPLPNNSRSHTMNTRTSALVAALAIGFGGTAFAQEATYEYPQAAVSGVSRAPSSAVHALNASASVAVSGPDCSSQPKNASWP